MQASLNVIPVHRYTGNTQAKVDIIIGRATIQPSTRLTATPVDIEAALKKQPSGKTTIFKK
jgi:hypothetical protein